MPDVIGRDLDVLFCGINPGLWSAAVGHHFARPGNRFWKVLHLSGLTAQLLRPDEERRLLDYGLGITNLVGRATASADELSRDELYHGARQLEHTVASWKPRFVVVLGMGAFRTAFGRPRSVVGEQRERVDCARVFVLPNPSGLQARYQLPDLVEFFSQLRQAVAHERR